jgi:hypothetical protein
MKPAVLSHESVRFRSRIIDGLVKVDRDSVWYIDSDTLAASCPICRGPLSIYFAGYAPRAEIVCRLGCAESDVAAALARMIPRGTR